MPLHLDLYVALAGLFVGFTVGLTGMGGGALMTPFLVLLFNVQPLAAVSSDLVAAMVMKPVGGGVHLRRGTVNFALVRWLMVGSVPAAFAGVLMLRQLGDGAVVQERIKLTLGVALLLAAASIAAKSLLEVQARRSQQPNDRSADRPFQVRLLLYPMLSSSRLVGTDLVQAIPLVASAALGHLLFGDFRFDLTSSLLVGSLPGVYLGAKVSSRAKDGIVRPALVLVLIASGLKLVGVDNLQLGLVVAGLVLLAAPAWGALDAAVHPAPAWASAPVGRRLVIGAQLVGAPVGLGFLVALAYFGLIRRHLAVPLVPEVVPVAAEPSGGG